MTRDILRYGTRLAITTAATITFSTLGAILSRLPHHRSER